MADTIPSAQRSWVMSRIRGAGTKPELMVRSLLHRAGYRYTLRSKGLPGRPDIVLPKYRTVVLVHGCFWHGHADPRCPIAKVPKSNRAFWRRKLTSNVERDRKVARELKREGWQVIEVWECRVVRNHARVFAQVASRLERAIGGAAVPECPPVSRSALLRLAEVRLHATLDKKPGKNTGCCSR